MKRAFDIFFSLLLIIIFLPIIIVLFFLVKVKLGSPVLFCQVRPGLYGKPFKMIKFRTMLNELDSNGNLLPDDLRLTKFGAFLRSTSLDELPELFNVFIGDMSLVGPRPLLMEYLSLYNENQFRRHNVRPGLTGLAQVNGRNNLSWEQKFELDIHYVENRSLLMDLRILFLTFFKVLKRDGISGNGSVTTEKFRGNIK